MLDGGWDAGRVPSGVGDGVAMDGLGAGTKICSPREKTGSSGLAGLRILLQSRGIVFSFRWAIWSCINPFDLSSRRPADSLDRRLGPSVWPPPPIPPTAVCRTSCGNS